MIIYLSGALWMGAGGGGGGGGGGGRVAGLFESSLSAHIQDKGMFSDVCSSYY